MVVIRGLTGVTDKPFRGGGDTEERHEVRERGRDGKKAVRDEGKFVREAGECGTERSG